MKRGTTPTFIFLTDLDCKEFDKLEITFAQHGDVIFTKAITDCNIETNEISVTLTEEETLLFDCKENPVEIQIRAGKGAARMASDIMRITAEAILKDGCLT